MSDEIQRYRISGPDWCERKDEEGQFIYYSDHLAALTARDARIRELEEQLTSARGEGMEEAIDTLLRAESDIRIERRKIRARLKELDSGD